MPSDKKAAKQSFELAADTLYKNAKLTNSNLIARQLGLKVQETPQLLDANAPATHTCG